MTRNWRSFARPDWWDRTLFSGFEITPLRIAVGILVILIGWLASAWLKRLLGRWTTAGRLDPGARYSLDRLLQYALVTISIGAAITVIGVDVRSLAVVAGALGIGVGLSLPSITASFVSGLILLFERPIRPGDRISLGTSEQDAAGQVNGFVRAIRLRSTTIQTPDNIILIVPNADLVGRTIVNWSHGDPSIRVRLDIGVAYTSDLDRVRQVMLAAALAHPSTSKDPPRKCGWWRPGILPSTSSCWSGFPTPASVAGLRVTCVSTS